MKNPDNCLTPLESAKFKLSNQNNLPLNLFFLEMKPKNSGYEGFIHYKNLLLHTCWALDVSELVEMLIQRYEIIKSVYDGTFPRYSTKQLKIKIGFQIEKAYLHPSGYIIIQRFKEYDMNTTTAHLQLSSIEPERKIDWDSIFMYEQKIEILEEK